MKTLLIVMLLSGNGFAIPFTSMESCLEAERHLSLDEVEESRCSYAHDLVEHD